MYVLVRVREDPRFVREGNDVYSTVELTMTQAALGASVTVPTLDGEKSCASIRSPAGPFESCRGRGMPSCKGFGQGDHRVLVNVLVPQHLNEDQRRLLEEFEAVSHDTPYRADEGFFEKLKSAFRWALSRRLAVRVPRERVEEARAVLVEVFPEGFEKETPETRSSWPRTATTRRASIGCARRSARSSRVRFQRDGPSGGASSTVRCASGLYGSVPRGNGRTRAPSPS